MGSTNAQRSRISTRKLQICWSLCLWALTRSKSLESGLVDPQDRTEEILRQLQADMSIELSESAFFITAASALPAVPPPGTPLPWEELEMAKLSGERYTCRAENSSTGWLPLPQPATVGEGYGLLDTINCAFINPAGYWRYEWCHHKHNNQFHVTGGKVIDDIVKLGKHSGTTLVFSNYNVTLTVDPPAPDPEENVDADGKAPEQVDGKVGDNVEVKSNEGTDRKPGGGTDGRGGWKGARKFPADRYNEEGMLVRKADLMSTPGVPYGAEVESPPPPKAESSPPKVESGPPRKRKRDRKERNALGEKLSKLKMVVDHYEGGKFCVETNSTRRSEVHMRCCQPMVPHPREMGGDTSVRDNLLMIGKLMSVREQGVCDYVMEVCTPALCPQPYSSNLTVRELLDISDPCFLPRSEHWWTYEFCWRTGLDQIHYGVYKAEDGSQHKRMESEFSLGRHLEVDWANEAQHLRPATEDTPAAFVVEYTGGTPCDISGLKRSTQVFLMCGPTYQVTSQMEDYTCHYKITATSPVLCRHPALGGKPPATRTVRCTEQKSKGMAKAKSQRASGSATKQASSPGNEF